MFLRCSNYAHIVSIHGLKTWSSTLPAAPQIYNFASTAMRWPYAPLTTAFVRHRHQCWLCRVSRLSSEDAVETGNDVTLTYSRYGIHFADSIFKVNLLLFHVVVSLGRRRPWPLPSPWEWEWRKPNAHAAVLRKQSSGHWRCVGLRVYASFKRQHEKWISGRL